MKDMSVLLLNLWRNIFANKRSIKIEKKFIFERIQTFAHTAHTSVCINVYIMR